MLVAALPGAPRPAHAASLWARRPQRVGKAEGKAGGVCVFVCVCVGVLVCLSVSSDGERGWGVKKVKREERGETGRK